MELVKSWSGPNTNTPNNRSRMGREGNRKAYPLSDLRRRQSARGSTTLLAALVPPLAAHAALLPAPPPAAPRPPPAPAQGSRHHRRRAMHREREEGETEGKRRTEASDGGGCSGARRRVREMGATDASCWILLFLASCFRSRMKKGNNRCWVNRLGWLTGCGSRVFFSFFFSFSFYLYFTCFATTSPGLCIRKYHLASS
jgi:hypothetical protein